MAQVGKPQRVDFGQQYSDASGEQDLAELSAIDPATIPAYLFSPEQLPWETSTSSAFGKVRKEGPNLDEVVRRFETARAEV